MNRIIVEIDHPSNLERFTNLLEDLNYVKYFRSDKGKTEDLTPLTDKDWNMAGRPATDDEFENMVNEI